MSDFDVVEDGDHSDFDIVGNDADSPDFDVVCNRDVAPRRKRRRRLAPLARNSLKLGIALLGINGISPPECNLIHDSFAKGTNAEPKFDATSIGIAGIVLYLWFYRPVADPIDDVHTAEWCTAIQKRRRRTTIFGFLEYRAEHVFQLDGGIHSLSADAMDNGILHATVLGDLLADAKFEGRTWRDIASDHGVTTPLLIFSVSHQLGECICKGTVKPVHVQTVNLRMKRDEYTRGDPTWSWARKLAIEERKAFDSNGDDEAVVSRMLKLPTGTPDHPMQRRFAAKAEPAHDPVRILKEITHVGFLTDVANTEKALTAALDVLVDDDALAAEVRNKRPKTMKRTAIQEARLKLDPATMLIERRELAHYAYDDPDGIESIHIYSDASPVTGSELQGMVMEVVLAIGTCLQWVMPGVQLHFGGARALDKVLAFLWSLYLMAGPNAFVLSYIIGKITSLCTDMGTEIRMIECPNILHVWLLRLAGVPLDSLPRLFRINSRLFHDAVKIPDWSHIIANLMKMAVQQCERWPEILTALRTLCRFFRVREWRMTIVRKLRGRMDGVDVLLERFTANLIKWRYETVADVFEQVGKLRDLCEYHLKDIVALMGPGFQDKQLLIDVQACCRWGDLWVFVCSYYTHLFSGLEIARHWGLVCKCCKPLRDLNQKVECWRKGRRLKEGRVFIAKLCEDLAKRGRDLSINATETVVWIFRALSFAMRSVAQMCVLKFKWLSSVPWRVVEAEDIVQAGICAEQLRSGDTSKMTPLELDMRDNLLLSLEASTVFLANSYIQKKCGRGGRSGGILVGVRLCTGSLWGGWL